MEKISINRTELCEVLCKGGAFAGKSKIMPILNDICITTKDNRIRVESSDSENYIRSYGHCDSTANMSFCVNAKEFVSYIDLLSEDTITMEYDSDKKQLIIKHNSGKITLPTCDSEEFPVMKPMKESTKIEMPGDVLAGWLTKAGDFAMKGNMGVVLEGIYIYANSDYIGVCGGEHSQIFTARVPNTYNIPEFGVVLPKVSANIMAAMCATSEKVTLMQDENALYIRTGNMLVYSLLINSKYPNVSVLFKQKGNNCFSIDKSVLLQSVKRIESQTVKDYESIQLRCTGSVLELSYNVDELSKYLSESLPCDGGAFDEVTVDIKRFKKALTNYNGDKITIYHEKSERSPFFFENHFNDSVELSLLAVMLKNY